MKKIGLGLVLLALAAGYFNPTLAQHREGIALAQGSSLARGLTRLALGLGGVQYHNYLLFSTTTDSAGKTLSVGLLGKIFVPG
ncbi:MAG: hypothetical protein IH614_10930 [Desulfuromonadales bacterium]|nr:hypothetical protein [Desulfuromonadales bacterium]